MKKSPAVFSFQRTEHDEQADVVAWAELCKGQIPDLDLLFSTLNGVPMKTIVGYANGKPIWRTNYKTAERFKQEGMKKGVPDLLLLVPSNGWHGLAVEMKRKRGEVSPEQATWLDRLSKHGYLATACWSAEEAIQTICEYLGVKNPAEFL